MTDFDKRTLTRTHSHQISKLIYTEMIYSDACACVLHTNSQLVVFEKISNIFECKIKCTHGRQNGEAYGKKETFFIFFLSSSSGKWLGLMWIFVLPAKWGDSAHLRGVPSQNPNDWMSSFRPRSSYNLSIFRSTFVSPENNPIFHPFLFCFVLLHLILKCFFQMDF